MSLRDLAASEPGAPARGAVTSSTRDVGRAVLQAPADPADSHTTHSHGDAFRQRRPAWERSPRPPGQLGSIPVGRPPTGDSLESHLNPGDRGDRGGQGCADFTRKGIGRSRSYVVKRSSSPPAYAVALILINLNVKTSLRLHSGCTAIWFN